MVPFPPVTRIFTRCAHGGRTYKSLAAVAGNELNLGHERMRILVLQESDWIERGPHQPHHLLERMAQRGHEVRVIDFEIGWRDRVTRERIAPRRVVTGVHKVCNDVSIAVV